MATAAPVTKTKTQMDTTQEYLGATNTMEFGVVPSFSPEDIQIPVSMSEVEMEAFMHEPVMVTVMSSGKDNEPQFVQTAVNGVSQWFKRDTPIVVKRMFVERLARAKETGYTQIVDSKLGEEMNKLTQNHSQRYPFAVNRDDNPRGAAWLRAVLAS